MLVVAEAKLSLCAPALVTCLIVVLESIHPNDWATPCAPLRIGRIGNDCRGDTACGRAGVDCVDLVANGQEGIGGRNRHRLAIDDEVTGEAEGGGTVREGIPGELFSLRSL